jgi:hypothetical protein
MAKMAFSIRVPEPIVDALDDFAQHKGCSRSEVVERVITEVIAAHRQEILDADVPAAPTAKLNLHLEPGSIAHLRTVAGNTPTPEFLRKALACVLSVVDENGIPPDSEPTPSAVRTQQRARRRVVAAEPIQYTESSGAFVPITAVVVMSLVAFLIGVLIAWLLLRRDAPNYTQLPVTGTPSTDDNAPGTPA